MVHNNPKHKLRARGNLTYLEFIRLLRRVWAEAHPDIPIVPSGAEDPAKYPCIYYGIQLRKTHPNEPKMRYRETKEDNGEAYVIGGQRFQSVVNFTAIAERDPVIAEELIELFEDFMLEYTPVFKELGVSELVYSRRIPDTEENRPGIGVVRRTVAFLVTTEKVISTRYDRLQEVVVNASMWLEETKSSTHALDGGGMWGGEPRYYLYGADSTLKFHFGEDDLGQEGNEEEDRIPAVIRIPATNFRSNDRVYLLPDTEDDFPEGLTQGFYQLVAPVSDQAFSANMGYTFTRFDDDELMTVDSTGSGIAYWVPTLPGVNLIG